MRFITISTIALVMCVGFMAAEAEAAPYYKLTPSQKHFTSIILQLKTFRSVEWESPVSMWVRVSSGALGANKQQRALELADAIADRARDALHQPVCIHIYAKKGESIARSCVF